ncbi:hypothetical protein LQG66_24285 [Bradyrhizobium ontarionense]|uniref:L-asparaginase N-terminal domain-containing protein n=1 Tax=Bradyrhizobium ontarionense TaxID=2898149 RepID=A0ABY3R5C6_9BRAD|nr:hypothetical protein [Bradyrhizobium sp. A19]UFZ02398.1 hypothetical protein LQG66_24285 [Bradyrhizobium sp. A19]
MLTIDQDDGSRKSDETSRSVVLVHTGGSYDRRAPLARAARPDASFVTHLIATAAQLPQTRTIRRAAPAVAQSAYAARLQPVANVGGKTRQVI